MITPQQLRNPHVKPKWQAPVGVMESIVAYNCRVANLPRPMLALPMWEGAGNRVMDLSGNMNHGTLYNEAKWSGEGLYFDGVNDYLKVLHHSTIDFADEDFTVSIWYKTTVAAGSNYLYSKNYGGAGVKWYGATVGATWDILQCYVDDGVATSQIDTTDDFNDGWWHNLTYQRNTVTNKIVGYVDGVWNVEAVDASGSIANNGDLIIGGRADLNVDRFYEGYLKQLCIYDVALTGRQIKYAYDNPYFMYRIPEELYGYTITGVAPTGVFYGPLVGPLGGPL